MVRKPLVVCAYAGAPPKGDESRKIDGGPLYVLDKLRGSLSQGRIRPWTKKCVTDLQNLGFDLDDAAALVLHALLEGRFLGAEWCQQEPAGPWAACDSYIVSRAEWIEAACKEMPVEYFVKFALAVSGTVVILISCHLPKTR